MAQEFHVSLCEVMFVGKKNNNPSFSYALMGPKLAEPVQENDGDGWIAQSKPQLSV